MRLSKRKIWILLAERGMTLKQLAEKTGIIANNLSATIGRASCRPETAAKIAAAFGVSVSDILED